MINFFHNTRKRNIYGILIVLGLWSAGFITNYLNAESFPAGRIVGLFIFGSLFVLSFIELTENLNLSSFVRILVLLVISPIFFYHTTTLIRTKLDTISILNSEDVLTKSYISFHLFKLNLWIENLILFLLFNVGILILWINSNLNPKYKNFFLLWINIFCLVYGWKILFLMAALNLKLFLGISSIFFTTDTFAFLGGRFLGRRLIKRNFAERISPHKTWEGFISGIMFGMIASAITFNLVNLNLEIWKIIILIIVLPLSVMIGDLSFSLLKRKLLLNNFSDVIPGHGGINDRFDGAYFLLVGFSLLIAFFW